MKFFINYLIKLHLVLFFICISATLSGSTLVDVDSLTSLLNNAKQMIPKNLKKADSLAVIVLEKGLVNQNDSLIGRSYYLLGVINYYEGNHLLSSDFYNKGLETKLAGTDNEFASALWNNLGIIYEYENEYEKAVEAYLKSLRLAEKLGDSLSIHQSYINIGLLYVWLIDYNEAETYLDKALDFFIRIEDDSHIGLCFHNLAILYDDSGKSEKVVETYNQAIDFYRKAGNQLELASALHDKINFLLEKEKYATAKKELKEAAYVKEQLSNPYTSGNFNLLRGKYFFYAEKDYETAEEYFLEAISLLEISNAKKQQINAYYMLANLYAATGNRNKHRQVLDKHNGLLQQNFNHKSSGKIAELRTLYEVHNKENRILELANQKQQEALLRSYYFIGMIGATVIGLVFFFFNRRKVYRSRQRTLILENEVQHRKNQIEKIKLAKQQHEKEAEGYRINLEKKEQELVFQSLKQANIEQLNLSVIEKLKPFASRFPRKKDQKEFSGALQKITREVSRDPLSVFEQMFIHMHGEFYEKLLEICPDLSQSELQLCALLRMNLPSKEIANLLNLSVSTIDQRRHSIRKKLGLSGLENLVSHLICV